MTSGLKQDWSCFVLTFWSEYKSTSFAITFVVIDRHGWWKVLQEVKLISSCHMNISMLATRIHIRTLSQVLSDIHQRLMIQNTSYISCLFHTYLWKDSNPVFYYFYVFNNQLLCPFVCIEEMLLNARVGIWLCREACNTCIFNCSLHP